MGLWASATRFGRAFGIGVLLLQSGPATAANADVLHAVYSVSLRTMFGIAVAEASEFIVGEK